MLRYIHPLFILHYHLGLQPVRRSTLADANATRPLALYKELFFMLLGKVRDSTAKEASQAILIAY